MQPACSPAEPNRSLSFRLLSSCLATGGSGLLVLPCHGVNSCSYRSVPFHHCTPLHCIALHCIPICTLLIDRLPNCFIVNLSLFLSCSSSSFLLFCPLEVRIQRFRQLGLHPIPETRNELTRWWQSPSPSVTSVRVACSSPPASAWSGTCIVPCSSSSTVDTPNISAICEHHRSLPSPTPGASWLWLWLWFWLWLWPSLALGFSSGSGRNWLCRAWAAWAAWMEVNNLPCPPHPRDNHPIRGPSITHPPS